MNKPPAFTVCRWLRDNGMALGALTDHDGAALRAAVQIAELWLRGDTDHRRASAEAFGAVVGQMQPQCQYLAYHAIAHAGDWCHRAQLWHEAGLEVNHVMGRPECKFGPRPAAKPALQEG